MENIRFTFGHCMLLQLGEINLASKVTTSGRQRVQHIHTRDRVANHVPYSNTR